MLIDNVQEKGREDRGSGDSAGSPNSDGLTLRSLGIGLILVIGLDLVAVYVRYIFHGSLMTYSHIPMSMLMMFMLLLLGASAFSKYTGIFLSSSEWHIV